MTIDNDHIAASRIPAPEFCGFEVEYEGTTLVVHIRKTFDKENKGQGWAGLIVDTYTVPLQHVIIDFGRNEIISSTVYAGLIQVYQGFHNRCAEGITLRNCSKPIIRALEMLHIDSMFTITEQA